MTDYVYDGKFALKDAMDALNPLKIVSGEEHSGEYSAISEAVNSKLNSANPTYTGVLQGASAIFTGTVQAGLISGGTW